MNRHAATLLLVGLTTTLEACDDEQQDPRPILSIAVEPIEDVGCPLRLANESLDGGVLEAGVLEAGVPDEGAEGEAYLRVAVAPDRRFVVRVSAHDDTGFRNFPQAQVTLLAPTSDADAERIVTLFGPGDPATDVEARLVLQTTAREVTLRVRALAREEVRILRLELGPASFTLEPRGVDALDGGIPEAGIDTEPADASVPEGGVPPPSMSVVRYIATLRCAGSDGPLGIAGQAVTFSGVPGVEPNPTMATTNRLGEAVTWVQAPAPTNFRLIARAGTLETTFPAAPTASVDETEAP